MAKAPAKKEAEAPVEEEVAVAVRTPLGNTKSDAVYEGPVVVKSVPKAEFETVTGNGRVDY